MPRGTSGAENAVNNATNQANRQAREAQNRRDDHAVVSAAQQAGRGIRGRKSI